MLTRIEDIKFTVALDNYKFKVSTAHKQIFEHAVGVCPNLSSAPVHMAVDLIFRFGTNYTYFTGYIWETCYQWFYEDLVEEEDIDDDIVTDILDILAKLTEDMFALVVGCIRLLASRGYSRSDSLDTMASMDWTICEPITIDTEEAEVVGHFDSEAPF